MADRVQRFTVFQTLIVHTPGVLIQLTPNPLRCAGRATSLLGVRTSDLKLLGQAQNFLLEASPEPITVHLEAVERDETDGDVLE